MATCPNCEGFGKKIVETASGTAMFDCVSCYGTGEVKPPFDTMEVCKEWGVTKMQFLSLPPKHQAEMVAYLEVSAQMRAVEEQEDLERRAAK